MKAAEFTVAGGTGQEHCPLSGKGWRGASIEITE